MLFVYSHYIVWARKWCAHWFSSWMETAWKMKSLNPIAVGTKSKTKQQKKQYLWLWWVWSDTNHCSQLCFSRDSTECTALLSLMLGTRSNINLKLAHHSLQICAFAIFGSWGYFEEDRTAGANSVSASTSVFFTTTIYMLCISLTANISTGEVCQSIGEIPDSTAQSLPIPSRLILSSPVVVMNYASWTESLAGLPPAETWQKLVAPPHRHY